MAHIRKHIDGLRQRQKIVIEILSCYLRSGRHHLGDARRDDSRTPQRSIARAVSLVIMPVASVPA